MSKRARCKNVTVDEEVELIALVRVNQHVLKNKKSDAVTWKQKSLGWEKLAVDFSSKTGSKRTVHSAVLFMCHIVLICQIKYPIAVMCRIA